MAPLPHGKCQRSSRGSRAPARSDLLGRDEVPGGGRARRGRFRAGGQGFYAPVRSSPEVGGAPSVLKRLVPPLTCLGLRVPSTLSLTFPAGPWPVGALSEPPLREAYWRRGPPLLRVRQGAPLSLPGPAPPQRPLPACGYVGTVRSRPPRGLPRSAPRLVSLVQQPHQSTEGGRGGLPATV